MEGQGTYEFPTGTKYIGEFCDGMFNGFGTLYFPKGGKYVAKWKKGKAIEVFFLFNLQRTVKIKNVKQISS